MSADGRTLAFVGGLHRSGTSPIARWLAAHPDVSGFSATGAPEDEGQHLQDVYPPAGDLGGAGTFALDPRSHRTEASPLVSPASRDRLMECWGRHWDLSRPVLLEKSPPNIVATRFLKALFPSARFVMVVRHPIAVSLATRRWQPTPNDLDALMRHWVVAHELLLEDARHVDDLVAVRYEDAMAAPEPTVARLFEVLGVGPHPGRYEVRTGLNDDYFLEWRQPWRLARRRPWLPAWPPKLRRVAERYEERVAPWGYSLMEPTALREPAPAVRDLLVRA